MFAATVTGLFTHHGLPLLFAAVAAESFGIPVPGETALIAFGVLASQGHYPIEVVIAVAAAAAIVGDNLGFWLIGRRGGRALIARSSWIERRTQRVLPRTEALIARYGRRAVFFGRFVSVFRETIAWVAGLAGNVLAALSVLERSRWDPLGGRRRACGVLRRQGARRHD